MIIEQLYAFITNHWVVKKYIMQSQEKKPSLTHKTSLWYQDTVSMADKLSTCGEHKRKNGVSGSNPLHNRLSQTLSKMALLPLCS